MFFLKEVQEATAVEKMLNYKLCKHLFVWFERTPMLIVSFLYVNVPPLFFFGWEACCIGVCVSDTEDYMICCLDI